MGESKDAVGGSQERQGATWAPTAHKVRPMPTFIKPSLCIHQLPSCSPSQFGCAPHPCQSVHSQAFPSISDRLMPECPPFLFLCLPR